MTAEPLPVPPDIAFVLDPCRPGCPLVAVVRPDRYLLGIFPPARLPGALTGPDNP